MGTTPGAPRVAGIVLAAGRSRRMGSPKPLLEIGGETFLARAVRVLREGGCDPVVAVVPPGEDARTMGEIARRVGAHAVENPDPSAEPIDSIQIGLGELADDVAAAVVMPVDVPLTSPGAVRAVVARWRAGSGSGREPAPIARPIHDGRPGHPVLFARSVWQELAAPDLARGARDVVHRHHGAILEVDVADRGVTRDVDTPADYEREAAGE
jgi:CTP:molybdopterin cytidylyltransferase MocA